VTAYVLGLDEVGKEDVLRCGGKGANLGELNRAGVLVPPGFCILADALSYVIDSNSLAEVIADLAAGLDFEDPKPSRRRRRASGRSSPRPRSRTISRRRSSTATGRSSPTRTPLSPCARRWPSRTARSRPSPG
jgi:hypothetical protein